MACGFYNQYGPLVVGEVQGAIACDLYNLHVPLVVGQIQGMHDVWPQNQRVLLLVGQVQSTHGAWSLQPACVSSSWSGAGQAWRVISITSVRY